MWNFRKLTVRLDKSSTLWNIMAGMQNSVNDLTADQVVIGRVSAQCWLAMHFTSGWWDVPVVYRSKDNTAAPVSRNMFEAGFPAAMFDLRGRSVSAIYSAKTTAAHGLFVIRTGDASNSIKRPIMNYSR